MSKQQAISLDIHKLDYSIPAPSIFEHLKELPNPVWLDSGFPESTHSRFDILSAHPEKTLNTKAQSTREVEIFFEQAKTELSALGKPTSNKSLPFQGGLIGYMSYDLGRGFCGARF